MLERDNGLAISEMNILTFTLSENARNICKATF
jgi:hypothetical protein